MEKLRRIPELDGLRGLAVSLILIHHFARSSAAPVGFAQSAAAFVFQGLWCGVDLFFVLSGFLITGILLRSRKKRSYFRDFYAHRAFRIFPLAYLAIAAWFWLAVPLLRSMHVPPTFGHGVPTGVDIPAIQQVWFWLYLQNWSFADVPAALGHMWSLAIEEQFYVVWPLVVYFFPGKLLRICFAVVGASLALRCALVALGTSPLVIYRNTFCRADELAIGAILAALAFRGVDLGPVKIAAMAAAACLGRVMMFGRSSAFDNPGMEVIGPLLWAVCFAGLLVAALDQDSSVAAVLRGKCLRAAGKYSYAMYVFHYPISLALGQIIRPRVSGFWPQTLAITGTGVALTVLLAVISWHALEKRMPALRDAFLIHYPVGPVAIDRHMNRAAAYNSR